MKFDSLTEALEEFKQRFPELAEKIENPEWQEGNRSRVARLKHYLGCKLIEAPIDDKSLNIKEAHYGHNFCEKDGVLVIGGKEDRDSMPRLQIRDIKFWNPAIVEQHLKHLDSRHTLESIIEEDPNFVTKVQKVFEDGWRSFLSNNGFEIDYYSSFDAERFEGRVSYAKRTLLHPTLVKKITTAYDLIITKDAATKTRKARFAVQFPDFEETLKELSRDK
ncbi:hypothetical protein KY315_04565, partial [Candidatus Woesearchaeota archaeon]|nr:hypothetical protein [Candidatus Woesearchaeota archaeon]